MKGLTTMEIRGCLEMKGYFGGFQDISEARRHEDSPEVGGEAFSNRPKMKLKPKLISLNKKKEVMCH